MMSEGTGRYKGLRKTIRRNYRMGKNRDVRWRIGLDYWQQNFEHQRNNNPISSLEPEELRIAEEIQKSAVEARISTEEVRKLAESARKYAEMLRAYNSELRETTKMLRQAAIELAQSTKGESYRLRI